MAPGNSWTQDDIDHEMFRDYDEFDGPNPGDECGRWLDGKLTHSCGRAGSEECDFECPYRATLRF